MIPRCMCLFSVLMGAACGDEAAPLPAELGDCDTVEAPAWAEASEVLDTHCNACHGSAKEGEARQGAPAYVTFDTPEAAGAFDVLAWSVIWSGAMPPDHPLEQDDAQTLWAWLSCGDDT